MKNAIILIAAIIVSCSPFSIYKNMDKKCYENFTKDITKEYWEANVKNNKMPAPIKKSYNNFSMNFEEFEKSISYLTEDSCEIQLKKVLTKNKVSFFIRLQTISYLLPEYDNKVYILFENGTVWKRNSKINIINKEKSNTLCLSYFELTRKEVYYLSKYKITGFKLASFKRRINNETSLKVTECAKSIQKIGEDYFFNDSTVINNMLTDEKVSF
jgi:hypothetical protein